MCISFCYSTLTICHIRISCITLTGHTPNREGKGGPINACMYNKLFWWNSIMSIFNLTLHVQHAFNCVFAWLLLQRGSSLTMNLCAECVVSMLMIVRFRTVGKHSKLWTCTQSRVDIPYPMSLTLTDFDASDVEGLPRQVVMYVLFFLDTKNKQTNKKKNNNNKSCRRIKLQACQILWGDTKHFPTSD